MNGKSRQGEARKVEGGRSPRDPQVAATWLTNNLFGLLKDQLGGKEELEGGRDEGHGHGQGGGDGEGELER